jgi:hypothetical protein
MDLMTTLWAANLRDVGYRYEDSSAHFTQKEMVQAVTHPIVFVRCTDYRNWVGGQDLGLPHSLRIGPGYYLRLGHYCVRPVLSKSAIVCRVVCAADGKINI